MSERPFRLEPLAERLDVTLHQAGGVEGIPTGLALLAERIDVNHRTARRYLADGLTAAQADRAAIRAGYHPLLVWPTWGADVEPDDDYDRGLAWSS